jgi:hypothetical protein
MRPGRINMQAALEAADRGVRSCLVMLPRSGLIADIEQGHYFV